MLYQGSKLESGVPVDISLWDWIFEQADNCKFNRGRFAGFRNAQTRETLSFVDLKSQATFLSTGFADRFGVGYGSHVAIFCSNNVLYPVVNLAAIRIGAIVTAASPHQGVDEMVEILKLSESELVVTDEEVWDNVCQAADKVGLRRDRVVLLERKLASRSSDSKTPMRDLISEAKIKTDGRQAKAWDPSRTQSNKDVPAYLSFTSGTTSSAKGVMISHHNVIAQIMQMLSLSAPECPKVLLGVLPFYHITGLIQILNVPIVLNQDVIVMPKFNMKQMLDVIVRYRCDELWLVPPLLVRLVNDPVAAGYNLGFVQQFNTGAAPLAKEIVDKLAKKFPHVRIRQAWGLTESCSALTLTPPADQTYENAHTVGKPVPETIIKIIDTDSERDRERLLGPGETGEVLAKGPQVTMGYYKMPQVTAETYDKDGFLHTGDIGFMNEAGFLTITDRLKEMIKVKGVAIAPAELEDLLLGHPLVADAAVVGIPDDYAGEVPKAFIVLVDLSAKGSTTKQILYDFVKRKRSKSKWLTGGIEFLDTIPKSASGKILRRVLKDQEGNKFQQSKRRRASKL
ncbi:hypothetical protein EDD37DRAFT_676002 [Exophiala viscosa]|uniref:uncharacterized protein n=1 Tax=Exophiala viscosa TaxID=2486360 RepID=UPI002198C397|nr:hypothetical protein EDD37DRAFT_676002 [Exophiala viscosa]